jgi:flagellar basal body L-ring protein FlgH
MRVYVIAFLLLATCLSVFAQEEEDPISAQAARAEAATPDEQPGMYVKIAEHQLKKADKLYDENKPEEASAAIKDVVTYSEKATQSSTRTGKRLKNTEIAIRKMATRLRDIQRSLSFDDQAPVKAAMDRLEALRSDLLARMFTKEKKK